MEIPYSTFKGPICKGSFELGTACGYCEKCVWIKTHSQTLTPDRTDTVHVLHWRYYDGSSCGVLRAYVDEKRANEDMDILSHADASRLYEISKVPVFRSAA